MYKRVEKVKTHFNENKAIYIAFGSGAVLAGITCLLMRDVVLQPISRGISATADHGISVIGKKVAMNNVSYILSDRQGAPSWVVRCKETGEVFTSQRAAATEMGLHASELSKHLNGVMDHVRGYHFERLCMAA